MSLIKSMVSSKSNEWATPQKLFDYLNNIFHFTLDPCATSINAKCRKFYTQEDDGLSKEWKQEIVFMNPPYGGFTKQWLIKAVHEVKEHYALVVCLIVSSTDRSYWHEVIDKEASEIWFLRGRIKFSGVKSTAPFASAIIIFKHYSLGKRDIKFIDLRKEHQ